MSKPGWLFTTGFGFVAVGATLLIAGWVLLGAFTIGVGVLVMAYSLAEASARPNMPVYDAVRCIGGDPDGGLEEGQPFLQKLRQAASDGTVQVWGRPRRPGKDEVEDMKDPSPMIRIPTEYWVDAEFNLHRCLMVGQSQACGAGVYHDLRLSRGQVRYKLKLMRRLWGVE